jgi:Na+-transporting NADH:ubiquinone oxidoreductase subunit B
MADMNSFVQRLAPSELAGPGRAGIAATQGAPHLRDAFNLDRAMRRMVIALVPCLFMAFYNTGYQANVDVAIAGLGRAPGWRGAVLGALGIGYDTSSLWASLVHGALYFGPVLAVTLLVAGLWGQAFAKLRNRPVGEGLFVIALVFALLLPASIPLWQAALGISFAIVFGREIFGGLGKNFLNPALTGLAFLYVTYPREMVGETAWVVVDAFTAPTYLQVTARQGPEILAWLPTGWLQSLVGLVPGPFGTTSTLACLAGAGLLLWWRVASTRIMAGVLFGMIAVTLLFNHVDEPINAFATLSWHWHLTLGSFAFGAVFLATDPASAAMTNTGRWVYGLFIGATIVLIRVANPTHPDGVMFAILLGNIFAPLIDYLVVLANIRRRARRGG